ncbi:MAG: hypothetical protein ACHQYP_04305 [Nitrospiria bacterium]
MKFRINELKWKMGGICAIVALIFFGAPAQADNTSFTYPIKRHVTGLVMSVTLPLGKGLDGAINVNEKTYRVSSSTLMVNLNEKRTNLNYFRTIGKVYMIVNIYETYNEALFISPAR